MLLNKSDERRHYCLGLYLRGKDFNLSLLSMMLPVSLLYWPLLYWGTFLLYPVCWEFFHERMLNFIKYLFCIYWVTIWFLFFILLMCYIYLWMLGHICIPGINLTRPCVAFYLWCIVEFGFPIFCRKFLHLYSLGILSYAFLFL